MKRIILLSVLLYSCNFSFSQNTSIDQTILKYCNFLKKEKVYNDNISAFLYHRIYDVYPDSLQSFPSKESTSFYNKKCNNLSSDKKLLNGIWNYYLNNVPSSNLIPHLIGMGLTSVEAEQLAKYITEKKFQLGDEKKKPDEIKTAELAKVKSFCIPIDFHKLVEPGTKPVLKDSLIKYVVFESPETFIKSPKFGYGYDTVHQWTLTLTQTVFNIKSSNIDETYTVMGTMYNEQFRSQEFQLADKTGKYTHNVSLSFWDSDKSYRVIFISIDYKEEFQFQDITIKEIQFQNK